MLSRSWWLAVACGLSLTLGCSKPAPAPDARVAAPSAPAAAPSSASPTATSSGAGGATGAAASQPAPLRGSNAGAVQQPGTSFNFAPAPGAKVEPSSRSPLRAAAAHPEAAKVPEYPNAGVLNDPLTGQPPTARQTTKSGQVLESGFDKEGRPFTRVVP